MAINFIFEVRVEFKDNGASSAGQDEALEEALSVEFERDDGVYSFMLPYRGTLVPANCVPGDIRVEFDELNEAISADRKIKEIIKQHGFLVIGAE